ncbi:MAG: hypothetical protein ACFB51_16605 [Anaerolineae bacterium]
MSVEKYTSFLITGTGHRETTLTLDDETVHIAIKENWMGLGRHDYVLAGRHRQLSSAHGWITIDSADHRAYGDEEVETTRSYDVKMIGGAVICEYFKIARSPHLEHPGELGHMQRMGYANWPDQFDLLMIVNKFTEDMIYAMKEEGVEILTGKLVSEETIKYFTRALLFPNKCKFKREDT